MGDKKSKKRKNNDILGITLGITFLIAVLVIGLIISDISLAHTNHDIRELENITGQNRTIVSSILENPAYFYTQNNSETIQAKQFIDNYNNWYPVTIIGAGLSLMGGVSLAFIALASLGILLRYKK